MVRRYRSPHALGRQARARRQLDLCVRLWLDGLGWIVRQSTPGRPASVSGSWCSRAHGGCHAWGCVAAHSRRSHGPVL
ncbi:hypothetical protein MBAV_000387 [Candidatus Magnetobacterium bavaricum]|uniref:Uncharacterized protein n=1 Tax=Candidatus Magnetobacterium bavaricum TaxID=29290 RepID=A0A0F3H3B9_9BACT|nr:hypothetical protein MBAV_000387 [Candidatus Magnetobacterium bavaricum]